MTDIDHALPDEPPPARLWTATALLFGLGVLHAWASWGYAGSMWSAHGGWLHAIERYAAGDQPYRDFAWNNPPLALWMLGNVARVTGSGLAAISISTTIIYFGILALLFRMIHQLTPEVRRSVGLTTLLFVTAYACASGVPLPLGTAVIGDAVGVLFLLGAVLAAVELARTRSRHEAILLGVLAGLSAASSQELWLATAYVVLIGTLVMLKDGSHRAAAALVVAYLAVAGIIFGWVYFRYGAGPAAMLRHSALLPAAIETTLPTAERIVIEAATVSAFTLFGTISLWLCLAIPDRVAARWAGIALVVFLCACAMHLGMSVSKAYIIAANGPSEYPGVIETSLLIAQRDGLGPRVGALRTLDDRFREHLFPILLPIFLLVVVLVRWRRWSHVALRNQVAALLGMCLVARSSSGFRGTDWYNVLFEIVTYVQMMRLGGEAAPRQAGRAVLAVLTTLMMVGAYTYFSQARGPLTVRSSWPAIDTPRGTVRWERWISARYVAVQAALSGPDAPPDTLPVLAFGPTGGWNYFLARHNPTPVTLGLHQLRPAAADEGIEGFLAVRPEMILIDHPFVPRSEVLDIRPWSWQAVRGPSRYQSFDRPRFDRLRQGCEGFGGSDTTDVVRFYHCPAQATR